MICAKCGSENVTYLKVEEKIVCNDCNYYGAPTSALKGLFPLPKGDARFGKFLGYGTLKVGDTEYPTGPMYIVPYNPDGDPGKSWEPPNPDMMDGEE